MYNKLEEQEYASMVQKYRSEYGGRNLRGFCLEHKVSYQKMLHCLRRESYRNTQQAEEEAVLEQGLHPLEVELPAKAPVTETQKWKPARKRESCESTPDFLPRPHETSVLQVQGCFRGRNEDIKDLRGNLQERQADQG